jgi:hypothetical protein
VPFVSDTIFFHFLRQDGSEEHGLEIRAVASALLVKFAFGFSLTSCGSTCRSGQAVDCGAISVGRPSLKGHAGVMVACYFFAVATVSFRAF